MLFQEYKIRILNFCFRMLGNRADAEEVTGDVFLALAHSSQSYDPGRKFSTWLYTIARNKCVSQLRKRKKFVFFWSSSRENGPDHERDIPCSNDQPDESLSRKEVSEHVRQAIASLSYEQREAIVLRQYHDFSYVQISQILGCTLEKVKILIFRAKESLRIELSSFILEEQS